MINTEKILVIYEETALLNEQLKKAIQSARKIYQDEENVIKIINDFNVIQNNTDKIIKETIYAVENIEASSKEAIESIEFASNLFEKKRNISMPKTLGMLLIVFIASCCIGFSTGYFTFNKYLQGSVLDREIKSVKNLELKYHEKLKIMLDYSKRGFIFDNDYLVVPNDLKISKTQSNGQAIFFKKGVFSK